MIFRPIRRFATGAGLVVVAALLSSCLEQVVVVDPETGLAQIQVVVRPELAGALANTPESLRLSNLEIEVRNATSGEIIADGDIPLDPAGSQHSVEVRLQFAPDSPPAIEGFVRITGESGRIEWSGRFGPTVPPGVDPSWDLPVQMGRGDLANLAITGLTAGGFQAVAAGPATVPGDGTFIEGEGGRAVVGVQGGPAQPQVFWGTRTPSLLSVDGDGRLTTHLPGAGELVVTAGRHALTIPVPVLQRVAALRIVPGTSELDALGAEAAFTVIATDPRGAPVLGRAVTWSGGGSVAVSLGDGRFRSAAPGDATVRASTAGVEATGTIRVAQIVRGVQADPPTLRFTALQDAIPISARAVDRNGFEVAGQPVTWTSSNPGVVVVSSDGSAASLAAGGDAAGGDAAALQATARSVAVGSAELTARVGGHGTAVPVGVVQEVHTILVSSEASEAMVGSEVRFQASAVDRNGHLVPDALGIAWESSNSALALVDGSGTVHAIAGGVVEIRAASGVVEGSSAFTVHEPPPQIVFDLEPGTSRPPATLGGYEMTPVPYPQAPRCSLSSPPIYTPTWDRIRVTPVDRFLFFDFRCVGFGWVTWSHGYRGNVYYTGFWRHQDIELPPGTKAFYFYVQPNSFFPRTFEVIAQPGDVSSGEFVVHGIAGARYVGVYATGDTEIESVRIEATTSFASGEYGWYGVEAPGEGCALCELAGALDVPPDALDPEGPMPELPGGSSPEPRWNTDYPSDDRPPDGDGGVPDPASALSSSGPGDDPLE